MPTLEEKKEQLRTIRLQKKRDKLRRLREKTMSSMTEDEAMDYATRMAEQKFEAETPSQAQTALQSFGRGATFGGNERLAAYLSSLKSGRPYEEHLQSVQSKAARGERAHPGTAMTADIAGSLGSSALIPGGAAATGAKLASKASKLQKLKELAKASGKFAAVGAGEGALRTRETLGEDMGEQALITGGVAGAVPGGIKGAGALGRGITGMFPGSKAAPKFLNKAISKMSQAFGGVDQDTAKAYNRLLNQPEELKKAFTSHDEMVAEIPNINKALTDSFKDIDKLVKERFRKKQGEAFVKNTEDVDLFFQQLGSLKDDIAQAMKTIEDNPEFYSKGASGVLKRLEKVVGLKDPKVGDLGSKLAKIHNQVSEAAKRVDVDEIERLGKEYQKLFPDLGGTLHRARMRIDDYLKYDPATPRKLSDEEELLGNLRDKIQRLTHEKSIGAPEMLEADKLYSQYKTFAEPFMKQFKGKGADGVSAKKVGDFISGGGSKYSQAQIQGYHKAAKDFFAENNIDGSGIDNAINQFSHFKDALTVGRLGGQTGKTTGRGFLPTLGIGIAGGYGADPVTGALLAAMSLPVFSPTHYLSTLNEARNLIAKVGKNKAAQMFGKAWPSVQSVLARKISTDEDVKNAAMEIQQATMGTDKTPGVPEKIKNYLNRDANKTGSIEPSIQTQSQRFAGGRAEDVPKFNIKDPYEGTTLGGRAQAFLDDVTMTDSIGLDPGEKPPASQPTEADRDIAMLMPMFGGVTKKVTKLDLALRKKMLEKKGKDLSGIEKERLRILEKAEMSPERKQKLLDELNDYKKRKETGEFDYKPYKEKLGDMELTAGETSFINGVRDNKDHWDTDLIEYKLKQYNTGTPHIDVGGRPTTYRKEVLDEAYKLLKDELDKRKKGNN